MGSQECVGVLVVLFRCMAGTSHNCDAAVSLVQQAGRSEEAGALPRSPDSSWMTLRMDPQSPLRTPRLLHRQGSGFWARQNRQMKRPGCAGIRCPPKGYLLQMDLQYAQKASWRGLAVQGLARTCPSSARCAKCQGARPSSSVPAKIPDVPNDVLVAAGMAVACL